MVKWLIGLFAVFAVASASGYGAPQQYQQQQQPEAPVLPKGGVEQYVAAAAPVQPIYQPQEPVYAPPPPPPPQQQPPVYQPVYAPQPPPQQSSPVPPPAYGPPPPPPQQQPPQNYAPQRPLVPDVPQYVQQAPPAPQPRYEQPAPPPAQQPPQTYAPQSYGPAPQRQPPAEDYCQRNNLIGGYHVEGCKPFYFACTPISTTRSRCPKGLFYDVEAQLCDYKHLIAACGGKRPLPPPPPQQQPPAYGPSYQQPQAYGQQPSYQQPQQQPPRAPEFDCSSKSDGVYVRGCSSKYYICMLGTSTNLACPSGTFYSASAEKCDYKAHVTECGGIPPPPPPAQNPATPYGQAPPPAYQPPSYGHPAPPPPQQQEPANACTGLANGIYGRKCNQNFVACTGGKAVDFTCPTGQAFNLKTVKCAPKIEIQTCPEYEIPQQQPPAPQPRYEKPAPQQQYVQQAPPAPAPQTYAPAPPPPPPPPAQQPPQQTYAPQQSYVQQAPPAPQQPSYSYGPAPQQPPRPLEDYCQKNNLADGYHGQSCSSHYFACSAFTTTRVTCPQGLFYDSETQSCDYKHLIAACGGKRPLPLPQQQPPAYGPSYAPAPPPAQQPPQTYAPQQSYVQQAPPAPQQPSYSYGPALQQQPPRPVEDFCQKNNLADGYHGQSCSSHYFACSAFTTTRVTCPQGLFYDMETQTCDYKHLIAACGGKRPLPPPQQQPPAYGPSYAPAPPPTQQQPSYVQQQPPQQYNPAPQGTY